MSVCGSWNGIFCGLRPLQFGTSHRKGSKAAKERSANVVIHDSLVTRAILDLIPEGTIRVPIRGGPYAHGLPLPEIAEMIIGHVQGGGTVVRLMNGDPLQRFPEHH